MVDIVQARPIILLSRYLFESSFDDHCVVIKYRPVVVSLKISALIFPSGLGWVAVGNVLKTISPISLRNPMDHSALISGRFLGFPDF